LLPHHPHPGATLSGNEHILVVEDDPAVLKLTVDILRSLGYQVHAVQSASQATKTVKRLNGLDLLLTDVVLVGESGYDLAQRLWANHPDLPVLFMSGYTDDEVFRRGVRDLRHAFLAKPFTPQTLARKVREVLRAHQQIKPPSAQEILP
jgi:CheY-like chemotaxis protein